MYAAIGQNESCAWPNPVEGEATPWSDLHYFGKALSLLETGIAKMALTKEEGLTTEEANMELGIGSHAFTTTQRAAIGKRVGIHRKADKLLHPQPRARDDKYKPKEYPKPGFEPRSGFEKEKAGGAKDLVCWSCGKKGHVAAKCRTTASHPRDTAAQEAAVKARLHQLTQATEHAALHGKQHGQGEG